MRARLAARPLRLPSSSLWTSSELPSERGTGRLGPVSWGLGEGGGVWREDPTSLGPSWDPVDPLREGPGRQGPWHRHIRERCTLSGAMGLIRCV